MAPRSTAPTDQNEPRLAEQALCGDGRAPAILVTGARGLVGAAVSAALSRRGHRVVNLDVADDRQEPGRIVLCDLADAAALRRATEVLMPDAVIHCGALSGPTVARDDPLAIVRSNVVATANVLELARMQRARRFIYCSSTSVYGRTPKGDALGEQTPLKPTSVYGASKAAGEFLVAGYRAQFGMSAVCLRISTVFGPRRRTFCAIREMILAGLEQRALHLPFGRHDERQYVYVEDVAGAILCALDADEIPAPAYTITGGTVLSLAVVAERVRQLVPGPAIDIGSAPDPLEDIQGAFSIDAARRDLGYRPAVTLQDGIAAYVRWLSRHHYQNEPGPGVYP